jgi:hypothetical protein
MTMRMKIPIRGNLEVMFSALPAIDISAARTADTT